MRKYTQLHILANIYPRASTLPAATRCSLEVTLQRDSKRYYEHRFGPPEGLGEASYQFEYEVAFDHSPRAHTMGNKHIVEYCRPEAVPVVCEVVTLVKGQWSALRSDLRGLDLVPVGLWRNVDCRRESVPVREPRNAIQIDKQTLPLRLMASCSLAEGTYTLVCESRGVSTPTRMSIPLVVLPNRPPQLTEGRRELKLMFPNDAYDAVGKGQHYSYFPLNRFLIDPDGWLLKPVGIRPRDGTGHPCCRVLHAGDELRLQILYPMQLPPYPAEARMDLLVYDECSTISIPVSVMRAPR